MLAFVVLLAPPSTPSLHGQETELPVALQVGRELDPTELRQTELRMMSAKAALDFGFASIAHDIYSNLLSSGDGMNDAVRIEILGELILAELNLGFIDDASAHFEELILLSDQNYDYLKLLILFHQNDSYDQIGEIIESGSETDNEFEKSWADLITAFWLQKQGRMDESRALIDEALAQSSSSFQRSWMELLIWREEILSGRASDTLAITLKTQIQNAVNPLVASQLTQQYAIVLVALGRETEAIRQVEFQLSLLSDDLREQKDRLLIFLALLSGQSSGKAKYAIEEILLNGKSERIRSLAFYYWLAEIDVASQDSNALLARLVERGDGEALHYEFLYVLALSDFYKGDFESSRVRIDAILSGSSNVDLQASALKALIGVCWSQDPPQYRLAAEHLRRLSDLSDSEEKDVLSLLTADSYYLNGDYDNALPFYEALVQSNQLSQAQDEVLFKITNCYLAQGNTAGARPVLDEFQSSVGPARELVWGSEWNFNLQLIKLGESAEAIKRLEVLREPFNIMASDEDLWVYSARMRLAWLLGYLYFQESEYQKSMDLCNEAVALYESYPVDQKSALESVKDELLVLSSRGMFSLDMESEALDLLFRVRDTAESETAASTYMIEARHYWSVGDPFNAQRALIRMADQYPTSQYAPVALYEAAMNVEARGNDTSDQEAIALYERISNDFPTHPLNFVSKLRQGNLLRKSNQFALAIPFYESLLNEFSGDSRLYLVQMALGESYMALGSTRSDYIDEAIRIMERIYDLNNLPLEVRLEAGTKAAIGLIRVNRIYRAQEVLWRVVRLVRADPDSGAHLGASGRYWLARAVLVLSEQLGADGNQPEKYRLIEMAQMMNLPGLNLLKK